MNAMERAGTVFVVFAVAGGCLLGAPGASADRGGIVSMKHVDIEEPAQRAIIGYNGVREILILQTDVRATQETKIVEFMPLPTKPEVSLAPEGCFAALADIVKKHNVRYVRRYRGDKAAGGDEAEAVQVVVEAQLGPHGVTVVEVKDADAFVRWVREFFRQNELGEPALSDDLRKIVAGYLERGIGFFAFDLVTVSPETKTVQPLTYEFKTDRLYYPLEVTNLYGGTGVVELFTILPAGSAYSGPLETYITIRGADPEYAPAKRKPQWRVMNSTSATLETAELGRLHPSLVGLMWGERGRLGAVRYEGPLHFGHDVHQVIGYQDPSKTCEAFLHGLRSGKAERLEAHAAVPFAWDRKRVITDRTELLAELQELAEETRGHPLAITHRKDVAHFSMSGYRFIVRSRFDREFVEKHLLKARDPAILGVTFEDDEVLFFLRREDSVYRVVGFSD